MAPTEEVVEIDLPNTVTIEVKLAQEGSNTGTLALSLPDNWSADGEGISSDTEWVFITNTSEFEGLESDVIAGTVTVFRASIVDIIASMQMEAPEQFSPPNNPESANLEDFTRFLMWASMPNADEVDNGFPQLTTRSKETLTSGSSQIAVEKGTFMRPDEVNVDYMIVLAEDTQYIYAFMYTTLEGESDQFHDTVVAIAGSVTFGSPESEITGTQLTGLILPDERGTVPLETETGFGAEGCSVTVRLPADWVSQISDDETNLCLANSTDALRCLGTAFMAFEMIELGPLESGQINGTLVFGNLPAGMNPSTLIDGLVVGPLGLNDVATVSEFSGDNYSGVEVAYSGPSSFFDEVEYDSYVAAIQTDGTPAVWAFNAPAGELIDNLSAIRAIVESTQADSTNCPAPGQ